MLLRCSFWAVWFILGGCPGLVGAGIAVRVRRIFQSSPCGIRVCRVAARVGWVDFLNTAAADGISYPGLFPCFLLSVYSGHPLRGTTGPGLVKDLPAQSARSSWTSP